jgi:hypothetical protein
MSMARCPKHGPPSDSRRPYVQVVNPVGYPNPAVICNMVDCTEPAQLWLDEHEASLYLQGQRLFWTVAGAVKIRVE